MTEDEDQKSGRALPTCHPHPEGGWFRRTYSSPDKSTFSNEEKDCVEVRSTIF